MEHLSVELTPENPQVGQDDAARTRSPVSDLSSRVVGQTDESRPAAAQEAALPSGDDHPEEQPAYYKSQAEVDAALARRLQAERDKLARTYEADVALAQALRARYPGLPDEALLGAQPPPIDAQSLAQQAVHLLQEEADIRQEDDSFDLVAALQENSTARRMLTSGAPVREVYDYLHLSDRIQAARAEAESQTLERIRARGRMPSPLPRRGGGGSFDARNLTQEQVEDIQRRLRQGEKVRL
jgi:hypothetical protein